MRGVAGSSLFLWPVRIECSKVDILDKLGHVHCPGRIPASNAPLGGGNWIWESGPVHGKAEAPVDTGHAPRSGAVHVQCPRVPVGQGDISPSRSSRPVRWGR